MATEQLGLFKFNRDLQAFAKSLDIDITKVVKKIGFDLFRRIIVKTPWKTGRARASWTIAVNEPDRTVMPEGNYRVAQSNPEGMASAKGNAALAKLQPYEPVWISNNLPYIEALEQGHSQKAPEGMVGLAIQETERELDTAIGVTSERI